MQEHTLPGGPGEGAVPEPTVDPGESVVVLGVDTTQHAQQLLAEHVPLTLLADLLTPAAPTSEELLVDEGLPGDPWWEPQGEVDAAGA